LQSIHKGQDDVDFRIGWQDSSDASINTALYIDSTGNVGIGTVSPSQVLDVVGGLQIGNTSTDESGAIRWNDPTFQGYNGTDWLQLSSSTLLVDELDVDEYVNFSTTEQVIGTSYVNVTNGTLVITTAANDVVWIAYTAEVLGGSLASMIFRLVLDGQELDGTEFSNQKESQADETTVSVSIANVPGAGTHTYNLQGKAQSINMRVQSATISALHFKTTGLGTERWLDEAGDTGTGNFIFNQNLTVLEDINFTGLIYGNGSQLTGVGGEDTDWNVSGFYLFPYNLSHKVGIGTSSPDSKLNIVSTVSDSDALIVQDDARKIKIGRDSIAVTDLSDVASDLYLSSNRDVFFAGSGAWKSSGNVGIGTTSPESIFDVSPANTGK
ncbi:hypothetical protein LCGC14_2925790, partial [marine sediment metagenome]